MVHVALYSPDPVLTSVLAKGLHEYRVTGHATKEQLKQSALNGQADVIVLDFDSNHAPVADQLAFYDDLGDLQIPIVVMTDDTQHRISTTEFLQRGAFDCIRKPPSLVEFKIILRRAHEHAMMKRELERIRREMHSTQGCDRLVGSSGRAQVVYDLIRRVANLNAYILITGESGTGKELVANALHNLSNRSQHPFVAVSCGAIPETLIESELFGHEKGAFTGSTGTRMGYLEQAGAGTLLLDEIGELSLNTQVKLLRVLQQKEFCRLGSNKPIPLRARVLFATHRNLQRMVDAGTFRQDLYFRVNVMSIEIPALRDRTEDIPTLARHFLKKYSAEYEKPVGDIRPNAMELLVDYEWPGNIRELENVIQGAVIKADGDSITRADLPEHLQAIAPDKPFETVSVEPGSFEDQLWQFKVELANKAIHECSGNKSLAARRLRVSRAYLHRLIRMNVGPESAEPTPVRVAV